MIPEWWRRPRLVSVCVDTKGWFDPFAAELVARIERSGDSGKFVRNPAETFKGGIAFYLSCLRITPAEALARNRRNLVVHASALPHGRGFSPIVWQVLEGSREIPISMISASEQVDSGDVVLTDRLSLGGYELNDEIRSLLGKKIVEMCLEYLATPEPLPGAVQVGQPSWYRRRGPEDSRLDPEKSIAAQFDLLRVVDNERYPAFFDYRGHRYTIRIEREKTPAGGTSTTGEIEET